MRERRRFEPLACFAPPGERCGRAAGTVALVTHQAHGRTMLHDFIVAHGEQIITRARERAQKRAIVRPVGGRVDNGVPLFLSQLTDVLAHVAADGSADADGARKQKITDSAALHGHDLLRDGFSVAQVVHGYGDVCQAVTELAGEMNSVISPEDFQVFNHCLDDAIAGAVTAYAEQREQDLAGESTERLGIFAHELRNFINTAVLSFDVIKRGTVGVGGSTGAIHARSLAGLRALVERSLAEVRLEAGMPLIERVSILEFIEEIEVSASMQAEALGLTFTVGPVDAELVVDADRQFLTSALSNLAQNAFKFTRARGNVSLSVLSTADRVLIEIGDECGGLPRELDPERMLRPFVRGTSDTSGLGLGLAIAVRAVRANKGDIRVRDVPGTGCVFTVDLPRRAARAS